MIGSWSVRRHLEAPAHLGHEEANTASSRGIMRTGEHWCCRISFQGGAKHVKRERLVAHLDAAVWNGHAADLSTFAFERQALRKPERLWVESAHVGQVRAQKVVDASLVTHALRPLPRAFCAGTSALVILEHF